MRAYKLQKTEFNYDRPFFLKSAYIPPPRCAITIMLLLCKQRSIKKTQNKHKIIGQEEVEEVVVYCGS